MTLENKVSMRLLEKNLAERICEISELSQNIIITNHAEDRMDERGIGYQSVLEILRNGTTKYDGVDEHGNKVAIVTKRLRDTREAGVVTAVVDEKNQLVIITVEWMDIT